MRYILMVMMLTGCGIQEVKSDEIDCKQFNMVLHPSNRYCIKPELLIQQMQTNSVSFDKMSI